MIEKLKQARESLAWVMVGVVVAYMALALTGLVPLLNDGVSLLVALAQVGSSVLNVALMLVLVALVASCVYISPTTRRALPLARVAATVLSIGVAITLVCWVSGLISSPNALSAVLEVIGGLIDLLVKSLGAGVLWVLARGLRTEDNTVAEPEPVTEPAVEKPRATSWRRDEASGQAWSTAAEAAAGQPGAATLEPGAPAAAEPANGEESD